MSRLVLVLALLLALTAAAAAALIVIPAPSKQMAFLAVVTGEKSIFIIGAAVLGAVLALFTMGPGTRAVSMISVLLCLAALIVALIPPAQALRLAGEQRVALNFDRYLRGPVDTQGPVKAERTVTYATVDGRPLGLDVYAPQPRPAEPTRAIVVVHGGGWSSGERGDASRFSKWLVEQGFTVFDVEYRTTPQPNWKNAIGDVKCAVGWIRQHASTADWNVAPKRITLLGRSAGGHLALLAAYTPGDPKLPASCVAPDTRVESVIAYYAPTDLVWGYAHPSRPAVYDSSEKLRGFLGGPPESTGDLYRMLSPTERVTPTSPRTLLVHGGRDQFIGRQHLDMLAEKLRVAEVRHDTLIIPYAQHAFDFVFGGLSGQIAEAVLLRFLNAAPGHPLASSGASDDTVPTPGSDGGGQSGDAGTAADAGQRAQKR
jgi:acetyl esterase/lipase